MSGLALAPEQEAEARLLAEVIGRKAQEEALRMARILVSSSDAERFGQTEYELRDSAHRVAAHALEAALRERKKGVPGVEPELPHVVAKPPGSSTAGPVASSAGWGTSASPAGTITAGTPGRGTFRGARRSGSRYRA